MVAGIQPKSIVVWCTQAFQQELRNAGSELCCSQSRYKQVKAIGSVYSIESTFIAGSWKAVLSALDSAKSTLVLTLASALYRTRGESRKEGG